MKRLYFSPGAIGPGLHDSIIASCQRAGFSPILGQEAPQISSIVYLVAAGFGVSIVPRSIEQIRADGIVYVPIKGGAPIRLAVRKDNRSAAIRNFVAGPSAAAGARLRSDLARPDPSGD
jgi:DNA-binding transcriptional LysR family regulator